MRISRILSLVGLLLLPVIASAQPPGPGWGQEKPSFERIQQLMKMRMVETLDLKEEQSVRFITRFNEHEKRRRELMKLKGEALDRIEKLVKDSGDEREVEKLFPDALAIDVRMMEERTKFFNGLSDILTITQRAKLLLFERKFERELRDAVRETQHRRMKGEEVRP
jgi:Spy/CpxP family protein refolding chaperone